MSALKEWIFNYTVRKINQQVFLRFEKVTLFETIYAFF